MNGHWNGRINQGLSNIQHLLCNQGWLKSVRFALLGLLIAISLHAGIAVAIGRTLDRQAANQGQPIEITSQPLQPSTIAPVQLVQQAEEHYQAGQISEAITLWQQAATHYEQDGDRLNQALVLSFLAAAYADLGQRAQANRAIADSLVFIQTSNLETPNAHLLRAQVLTVQGKLQLAQGQAVAALNTWQQAEVAYRQTNDSSGILGSQINQARALQAEGLYRRAITLLTQVEQSLQNQPDSRLKMTGLRNLGKMLRLVGNLAQSRTVLEQSLAIAQKLDDKTPASDISGILFSLGNTVRAQGDTNTALDFYQKAIATAPSLTAKTQIELAQLSLLVDSNQTAAAQRLLTQIQSQLAQLPPSRLALYAQIDLARNLVKLGRGASVRGSQTLSGGDGSGLPSERLKTSAQELAIAIQQIRASGDARAESYGLGTLGSLYEITQQWNEAKTLTQQALSLAQSIDAPDIAYQWQWQLGRIFCQGQQPCSLAGSLPNATIAYGSAVKTLQSLRGDLVAVNPDVQFSFRESVEPVYRQFVDLLLQSAGNAPSQENLIQARETIEALQLAELDNFFREACTNAHPVKIDQIDPQAAVIYPIILPSQLAVILALPNQPLRYFKTPLPQAEVERILTQMRQSLRPTAFVEDWLPSAQRVYDLLLRPIAAELAPSQIKTLVFVPDGLLRSLPMAALHDGQQYLVEKYSIVLTPGLQLLQAQPLERQRLHGLLAGLTQARGGFAALPNVAVEINQVKAEISAQVLLDQSFTDRSLEKMIDSTPSPIVHLATHGQFSSNADNTFILTWDGRINVKQLDQLLRFREGNLTPIELLVLSACQTATGDKRAALGMAGVAVRSGARSTLASLWSVSDRSTASLMIQFYRELGKPGVTKAEALRRAQVSLLHQDDYTSPYYWAPFVLLGNWL
ncbi:CHAT domain-containing protein (plasmid) [Kovacikia minuta CCNUW1]|uniref:CHAT domain-containing protein n=1 Tax=Kovacikia minuta TaxID=2931930 RepID=UPI001CCE4210|nr:CHAT domain-containing protein [Kovacikia minuta]UBF30377.1 CHAT domain-containing protein [Kovacikia minuta CCNUW1]